MLTGRRKYWTNERIGVVILLSISFLLLYYLKETYVMNLFDSRYPFLIRRFTSQEIYMLPNPAYLDLQNVLSTRIISVFIFHLIFFFIHGLFFWAIFESRRTLRAHTAIFVLLSLLMVVFFAINAVTQGVGLFYDISRILKDFFQSPVYLLVMIIIFRFWLKRLALG